MHSSVRQDIAVASREINHFTESQIAQAQQNGCPGQAAAEAGEASEARSSVGGRGSSELGREVEGDGGRNGSTAAVSEVLDHVVGHFGVGDFHLIGKFLKHESVWLVAQKVINGIQ